MILAEFNRENTPDIQFTQFRQLFHVFDTLTQEQCLKYPIAYLQYIRIRAMGTEPGAPGRHAGLSAAGRQDAGHGAL